MFHPVEVRRLIENLLREKSALKSLTRNAQEFWLSAVRGNCAL